MKYTFCIVFALLLYTSGVTAKGPQILPEPMLVNLFALTEASAALRICAESPSFDSLAATDRTLARRLQENIESLVRRIGHKYDEDLFGFFVQTRNDAAAQPDKIEEMRKRYDFCGNGFLPRMKEYVYASRQKLNFFLSQQPDAR